MDKSKNILIGILCVSINLFGLTATAATDVKIHEVQGNGSASPLVGNTVRIEGIVVGDFQDGGSGTNGDLNGFFVQEEDADVDGDPLTSEGLFVFEGSSPSVNVANGDLVRVEGEVAEFNGLTEITSVSGITVISGGNPLPTAATLSLPVTSAVAFEAYEGMYVTFPQALIISQYFNFDRFGEIVLTSERHLQPTAEFEPGSLEHRRRLRDQLRPRRHRPLPSRRGHLPTEEVQPGRRKDSGAVLPGTPRQGR